MKKIRFVTSLQKLFFGSLLAASISASAQTFQYNNGDLLIGLRATAGGTYDLVINAGPVAAFTNLAPGGKITITSLTGSLLKAAFNDTNNLSWSAFACFDASYPVPAQQKTLFMSRPRADVNTQSDPWLRYTSTSQGNIVSKVNGVGTGAVAIGSGLAAGPNNTSTALVEPESASVSPTFSYLTELGGGLNWSGNFQGDPEQSTAANFTTSGQVSRADFYWVIPGGTASSHPPGTYLGYFDFNTNGVLTYTSGPSSSVLVTPQIISITRNANTNTVFFTTGSSGTYTLRASSSLTTPRASWSTLTSVSGNGLTNSISEINATSPRFYLISAQ